jgi:hypothetical protein
MFEDAKRRHVDSLSTNNTPFGLPANNLISIIQELEAIAQKHTEEYFRLKSKQIEQEQATSADATEYEKILETYKLLIMPDKTLLEILSSLGREEAKKEFRRVAMLVHPDKNSHPNAKIAFQKIYSHFRKVDSYYD